MNPTRAEAIEALDLLEARHQLDDSYNFDILRRYVETTVAPGTPGGNSILEYPSASPDRTSGVESV